MKQVTKLHTEYDKLQLKYGCPNLYPIYGTGCINNPKMMFIFMNPTGRNISSIPLWRGIRAPWLGTKQVWDIFFQLGFLNNDLYKNIKEYRPEQWNPEFSNKVYGEIENNKIFITNLAKCTQIDARPLSNKVFKEYLDLMYKEIELIHPQKIVTFGNQVSSILLNKNIRVSKYMNTEYEVLNNYYVYPTYYPVGQGRRNMSLAIERIKKILNV